MIIIQLANGVCLESIYNLEMDGCLFSLDCAYKETNICNL